MARSRLLFIVPAYNEEATVGDVVRELHSRFEDAAVVVVDDGSSDLTAAAARNAGARVLQLPVNLGIGGAVQTGLLHALRKGYEIAVQVDGDGQHPADQVGRLLEPIVTGRADAVIGSRFLARPGYRAGWSRRVGIALFNAVNTLILRRRVTDATSGFRAYNEKAIGVLAHLYADDFPEPESILVLARNGIRVEEVAVEMRARSFGTSSITLMRSIYYMLKVMLAILVSATRRASAARGKEVGDEPARAGDLDRGEHSGRPAGIRADS